MQDRTYQTLLFAFLFTMVLTQATFATWPGIDLAFSHLFADDVGRFVWASGPLSMVNMAIRRTGEAVALVISVLCLWGLVTGRMAKGELRLWGFVALNVFFASGLIANGILKAQIGRARPADVIEFGGGAPFTPAFQISEHCARNCSFVSGEVSLAASLAIPIVIILWHRLPHLWARLIAVGLATAYVVLVSLLRIGLGRHFLSDAVFAVLFSVGMALILYPMLRIGGARRDHAHLPTLRVATNRLGLVYASFIRTVRP